MADQATKRFMQTLAARVAFRERYGRRPDPIRSDRLLWRAQSFRHLVHICPGQSVLLLGCGDGLMADKLHQVTRGENPVTCVAFGSDAIRPETLPDAVEFIAADELPGPLDVRTFDYVVALDLLDRRGAAWLLQQAYDRLKPAGQLVFYESNPWNPALWLKRGLRRLVGKSDPRGLIARPRLYELLSELGYIRVFAVYNDFVYPPLTRRLSWVYRNLSILFENMPGLRVLAGSILLHAQRPPRIAPKPAINLTSHDCLRHAVSVVVPCHNEASNLRPLVEGLTTMYGEYLHEIVLVDDNSKDDTRAVIEALAKQVPTVKPVIRSMPNGVGRALREGYAAATGRYVLSSDCDFQHLLPELRDIFDAAAEGFDVVVGSRFSRHSVLLNYPWQKILANRGFHLLARLLLWRTFRDLTNNLKLIKKDVLDQLVLTQPGFAINAETGLQPIVMGCKVREVPISWINRTPDMGVSSFHLGKVSGGYWRVLFNLVSRTWFGRGPYKALHVSKDVRRTEREQRGDAGLRVTGDA